jgi:hypothetical protein
MAPSGLLLSLLILDVAGINRRPLEVTRGKANVLFFVTNDCPIANSYAPEIARICASYQSQGINCSLIYVDPSLSNSGAIKHAQEYKHGDYPRIVDRQHELVKATGVTITPEVAVINRAGNVVYRGRIDDSYAGLAEPRRPAKSFDLRNALDELIAGRPLATPETKALGCYISDFTKRQ